MRFDPSQMTPEQIAAANAKHMQSMLGGLQKPDKDPYAGTALAGTAGVKGQQVSGISDLGYEPEFVPPQELNYISDLGYEPEPPNFTGALGINPDTGETFLPGNMISDGLPAPGDFTTNTNFRELDSDSQRAFVDKIKAGISPGQLPPPRCRLLETL